MNPVNMLIYLQLYAQIHASADLTPKAFSASQPVG